MTWLEHRAQVIEEIRPTGRLNARTTTTRMRVTTRAQLAQIARERNQETC